MTEKLEDRLCTKKLEEVMKSGIQSNKSEVPYFVKPLPEDKEPKYRRVKVLTVTADGSISKEEERLPPQESMEALACRFVKGSNFKKMDYKKYGGNRK